MKILFVSYGAAHVGATLPLQKEMSLRGHDCKLIALTTAAKTASKSDINYAKPIDYIDINDPYVSKWGKQLAKNHHTEGKGISLDESIAYLGISFRDLSNQVGELEAWQLYDKKGLNAFCPTAFMTEVLLQEAPDLVIATTSPRMEMASLRAAHKLKIPSICMIELFGILEEPWLSRPDNGQILTVSRTEVIDRLVAAGRSRDDFYLTGSPLFDQLSNPELPALGHQWRTKHDVLPEEKLVFWAEQPEPNNPELPRTVRKHLTEVCLKNNWKLVVRLHPSSTDASKENISNACITSYAHEPLSEVIHACDVAVTLTSTVGWEALLSDKPLLVLTISEYSNAVTYGKGDGALAIPSLDLAEDGLSTLLNGSKQSEQLAALRASLPKPGGASTRIADLIEKKFAL